MIKGDIKARPVTLTTIPSENLIRVSVASGDHRYTDVKLSYTFNTKDRSLTYECPPQKVVLQVISPINEDDGPIEGSRTRIAGRLDKNICRGIENFGSRSPKEVEILMIKLMNLRRAFQEKDEHLIRGVLTREFISDCRRRGI